MKTALYTIFRCTNYGALLQAYALAEVLRKICGEENVDVLNHRMDPRDNHLLGKITNPNTPWFQRWRNKRKAKTRYISPELFELRRTKTIDFINKMIRPTTHLYNSPEELRDIPRYKTVVVGSDQIWNPILNHDFGTNQYLCERLPEDQRRVAYAASFGVASIPDASKARYAAALKRFDAITVREKTGAEICEELIGKCPEVVLDPTMLLSADEWRDAAQGCVTYEGDYIAAYWVRTLTQADIDAIAKMAGRKSMKVLLMSAGPMPKLALPECIKPVIDAGPLDFVSIIANSSAAITDSFHGLVFSLIFEKPFLAVADLQSSRSNASRLIDICQAVGIVNAVKDINSFQNGLEIWLSAPLPNCRDSCICLANNSRQTLGILVSWISYESKGAGT